MGRRATKQSIPYSSRLPRSPEVARNDKMQSIVRALTTNTVTYRELCGGRRGREVFYGDASWWV